MDDLELQVGIERNILVENQDLLFTRMYVPEQEIGRDASITVYKAKYHPIEGSTLEEKNKYVALKVVNLGEMMYNNLYQETLRSSFYAHHKNIIGYTTDFIDGSRFYVVMPYRDKGSLRCIMNNRSPNGLHEDHIAIVLRECLLGVCFLHEVGHFHGDINAGNIFFHEKSSIQLAFASTIYEHQENDVASRAAYLPATTIGSWAAAPELYNVDNSEYTPKGDIWMIAITGLELAYGELRVANRAELEVMIKKLTTKNKKMMNLGQMLSGVWRKNLSSGFEDMLAMCLAQDPSERPTASELLENPFFRAAGGQKEIETMIKCYK